MEIFGGAVMDNYRVVFHRDGGVSVKGPEGQGRVVGVWKSRWTATVQSFRFEPSKGDPGAWYSVRKYLKDDAIRAYKALAPIKGRKK